MEKNLCQKMEEEEEDEGKTKAKDGNYIGILAGLILII